MELLAFLLLREGEGWGRGQHMQLGPFGLISEGRLDGVSTGGPQH